MEINTQEARVKKFAPSRIARTMAGALWPDVQHQQQIAKGVYGFSCAGHGGIIAVIGVADLDESAVEIARREGKTEFVGNYAGRLITSERYTKGTFLDMQTMGDRYQVWEVLVGEEDCDWAVVLLSLRDTNAALASACGKYLSETVTLAEVRNAVRDWNPDFWYGLTGEMPTADESYVVRKREFERDNADNYVTRAAWGDWHKKVPTGFVGVVASRKSDGHERYFLVPSADYQAREGSHIITSEQVWEDHA